MRSGFAALAAIGAYVVLFACASTYGAREVDGLDASEDGGSETPPGDANLAPDPDADADAAADAANPSYAYNDMSDAAAWSAFDLTPVVGGGFGGFWGGVFDGRYVYYVPYGSGSGTQVLRFDTHGTFTSAADWAVFSLASIDGSAAGYIGAAFDGRYVYLSPYENAAGPHGRMVRFDTTGAFTATASWTVFDASANVDPRAEGFMGVVFDGRFVDFVPQIAQGAKSGLLVRYDTTTAFTTKSSWSTFDIATLNAGAIGFMGGVYDGRYLTLIPGSGIYTVLARYDTRAAVSALSSWAFMDLATLDAGSSYPVAGFDGSELYVMGSTNGGTPPYGPLARFDVGAPFNVGSSWTVVDPVSLSGVTAGGLDGCAFDGRFLYFHAWNNGMVTRYDTQATLGLSTAWTKFDVTTVQSSARAFRGAVFDGTSVYLVPNSANVAARFEARSPNGPPPYGGGSFL